MFPFFILLMLFGFFLFWYKRMHAKEYALQLAMDACIKQNYQFLDESIGIVHMQFFREGKKFFLTRTFEFYYADHEQQRQRGTILQHGKKWLNVQFQAIRTDFKDVNIDRERKIIPFPGNYKS